MISDIKRMEKDNNVIVLGEGQYAALNTIYVKKVADPADGNPIDPDDPDGENILDGLEAVDLTNETTAERIVRKIEENGLTIQKVYMLLDNDGDGVLTR